MDRIPEADWKLFKKHHAVVHEAFSRRAMATVRELMDDKSAASIERFQSIALYVNKIAKKEDALFNDYRRSSALAFLRVFLLEGLLSDEQVAEYSDEVRRHLDV